MSQVSQPGELPYIVESKLRAVRRRVVAFRAAQGLMITIATLLAVMMAAMFIDWCVVLFSHAWRTLITVGALTVTAVVLAVYCVRPLVRRFLLTAAAWQVDRAVPSLQERWSTVTELAESADPPAMRGAPRLVRQVAHEAADLSHLVQVPQVVSKQTLQRCAAGLGVVAALLIAAFMTAPDRTTVLLQRFWSPGGDVSMTRITSLTGDAFVPRKEPLAIEAAMDGREQDQALLFIRDGGADVRVPLTRLAGSAASFSYKFRSVEDSFQYRFRAGDGQTVWHQVTAVDRPDIAEVRFQITPPAYSKLPRDEQNVLPRRCRALEGSQLVLELRPTKSIERMELKLGENASASMSSGDGQWYRYQTLLTESLYLSPRMEDAHGLTNVAPPSCRITVYPDKPPSVEIVSPGNEIVIPPDEEKIRVKMLAKDDLGIERAEVVVTAGKGQQEKELGVVPISLDAQQGAKQVEKEVDIDLKPFKLEHGVELSYAVRVADTKLTTAMSEPTGKPRPGQFDPSQAMADASKQRGKPADSSQRDSQANAKNANQTGQSQTGQPQTGDAKPSPSDAGKADQQADAQPPSEPGQQDRGPQQPSDTRPSDDSQRDSDARSSNKANQGSAQAQANASKQSQQSQPSESDSPPPNEMTMRPWPFDQAHTASSQKNTIRVDKWAGKFEGQAREKLRIAIDQYLKRLDEALAAAETPTNELLKHVTDKKEWGPEQGTKLGGARDKLAEADKIIIELRGKSNGTPYAFVGLQLEDIGRAHVTPARKHLTDAATIAGREPDPMTTNLDRGAYHIARARERLAALTKQYEAVKRQEKLAEAMERFNKMHQVFVEDMQAFLKSKRPTLNPRSPRGKMEVDEAYAKALQEYYEELKKVLAELSKVLADDPELLRRFMAMMRLEGITIRDQLTLLAQRQQALQGEIGTWIEAGDKASTVIPPRLAQAQLAEQRELAELAAQLHDNAITWMPRGLDASKGTLAESLQAVEDAARQARDVLRPLTAGNTDQARALADQVAISLGRFNNLLSKAAAEQKDEQGNLTIFVGNRMAESEKVLAQQAGWIKKLEAAGTGKYGRAASIDQDRLRWDTAEFGTKLDRVKAMLAGLAKPIQDKVAELQRIVSDEITAQQGETSLALKAERLDRGQQEGAKTVATFAKAETAFDELLTLIEEAMASGGQGGGGLMPPDKPTLENLLAMLEKECKACEKLGLAPLRLNIALQMDWMMPGDGEGAGAGGGGGGGGGQGGQTQGDKGQGKPDQRDTDRQPGEYRPDEVSEAQAKAAHEHAKQAGKEMEKARDDAKAKAAQLAKGPAPDQRAGPGGQPGPDVAPAQNGRDFNVLVSQLEKELRQSRANIPPEQYRRAVDEYFKRISEELAKASGSTSAPSGG